MAQTEYDVGDPITSRLKLGATPDVSTVTTVTVQRPDGTVIAGLTPGAWTGDEKTVQFYATDDGTPSGGVTSAAGDWLAVWKTTGTGASVAAKVYNVMPLPGTSTRVTWSPFLSDVADHVPFLSMDRTTPGSQVYLGTFTGNTSPTDEQARRHIDAAVAFVGAGFGTLIGALPRMARAVAAIRAAATLARAFGRTAEERAIADALERQAAADLKVLQTAVDNTGADTLSAVPVLSAPAPVPWGDSLLIDGTLRTSRQYLWPE